jgi:hypothetical protein
MKIIKKYNEVINESNRELLTQDQIDWCDNHIGSVAWYVNSDGEVYCKTETISIINDPKEFLVQFADHDGYFECFNNPNLVSLKGSPRIVRHFDIRKTPNLYTLEGCPLEVKDVCFISETSISNLIGSPKKVNKIYIRRCANLESLVGLPDNINIFDISGCNTITKLDGISYVNTSVSLDACHKLNSLGSLNRESPCEIYINNCALPELEIISNWYNGIEPDEVDKFKSDWEI